MDKTQNKSYIFSLIAMSALTAIIWNYEIFLSVINAILPGNVMHQSILSNGNLVSVLIFICTAYIMPFLTLIPIIYCTVKLARNKRSENKIKNYNKIWLIFILALNILFVVMIGGFYISMEKSPYPDLKSIIESVYNSIFVKDKAAEYVNEYLKDMYGEEYSFSIKATDKSAMPFSDNKSINYNVYENNYEFYFVVSYDINSGKITYNNFEEKLEQNNNVNEIKKLIDEIIGEGLTLYFRSDGIIFVYTGDEKISLSKAKEMYLSILKNYYFENYTILDREIYSQWYLGNVKFYIHFVDKVRYNKAWVNTMHPGEGDCMDCYASIGYGMGLRYLAADYDNRYINPEEIYEAVKQYLDDNYKEEYWNK